MRKMWIGCGWMVLLGGIVLLLSSGIMLLGDTGTKGLGSMIAFGSLMVGLGHSMRSRGRSMTKVASTDRAALALDRARVRQQVKQALWITGLIIAAVIAIYGIVYLVAR